jgi:endonuclease/exonuclease/phosphatase family metal-dependent hydrolase
METLTPVLILLTATTAGSQAQVVQSPELLAYEEVVSLSIRGDPPEETAAKLERLLTTPFGSTGTVHTDTGLQRRGLRVAAWNIERGREWPLMRLAFTDPVGFRETLHGISGEEWERAAEELAALKDADVVILNEVDFGMKRTGYVNVAEELAQALNMNHVFGVEFVEVDRLYTGQEQIELEDPEMTKALADDLRVDPAKYRGLHGNAILSRFPIRSARIHRLPQCYDWLNTELDEIAGLEKGRRWSAQRVFSERIQRQVRRGGRMALIAELETGSPGVTVISTHLEDRATPSCRREQMENLLAELQGTPGAVVLGGDLNTSGGDGTPTSVRYEIMKRVTDRRFWARNAFQWFSPVAVPALLLWPINYVKNWRDPTALSIPILAPNAERALFDLLRSFRFSDGGSFDFQADPERRGNGKSRTLANSNQRAWKGFRTTYRFERNYFGLVGAFRLDWLLVKPAMGDSMRPLAPRTLSRFNKLPEDRLSDHHPILVDLEPSRVSAMLQQPEN